MATATDSTTSSTSLTALQAMLQGSTGATNTGTGGTSATDQQDRFLKLLVAQMNNQDPLNPLDNSQVTSQLAQISTVQGIEQLNSTMSKFADQTAGNSAADAANLIGQAVLAPDSTITRTAGQTTASRAGVDLASPADQVKVQLLDASGNAVAVRTFTNQPAGTLTFEWKATDDSGNALPAGNYTMQVTASSGKDAVTATALATNVVTGVTQGTSGVQLALSDGTSVAKSDVKGVFRP